MTEIRLGKNQERRLRQGHLWVFSNEIEQITGEKQKGSLCKISAHGGGTVGYGFYNPGSLIAVRVISYKPVEDIPALLCSRIDRAFAMRQAVFPGRNSWRGVFGEGDFLPGLVIDKFNSIYILQVHSAGIELYLEQITAHLVNNHQATAVLTKHDYYLRTLEGLPAEDQNLYGDTPAEVITDGELKFLVDFNAGQKTGFYFDQVYNRQFARLLSNKAIVWDIFCNSGGFGMYSMQGGSAETEFVDSSAAALELTRKNIELNGLTGKFTLTEADGFDFLKGKRNAGLKADIIFLDPPAFAKNKKSIDNALAGYTSLHKSAFQCINDGGYIFFSSCSHHIDRYTFINTIKQAAKAAGKQFQVLHSAGAAADHPLNPSMPETEYLKFIGIRVFD